MTSPEQDSSVEPVAPSAAERSARVAAVFDRVADTYDQVGVAWFTPVAEGLVAEAAPRPGELALDVGCGRGAALFALAAAVGPAGRVTGIDLSPRMIEATRRDAAARGLDSVDLQVMDASAPDLPAGAYDLVVSSLVLFFLPDPAQALRAWRALLTPGGRVAVATFGDRDPGWVALDAVFRPYLPPSMLDARTTGAAGPFGSDEGVEGLLAAAGYERVRTAALDLVVTFADADQWYAFSWSHGQRAMWDAVPEADRPTLLAAAARCLEEHRSPDGELRLTQRVRYTLGVRPE